MRCWRLVGAFCIARYALDGLPNKVPTAEYHTVLPDENYLEELAKPAGNGRHNIPSCRTRAALRVPEGPEALVRPSPVASLIGPLLAWSFGAPRARCNTPIQLTSAASRAL